MQPVILQVSSLSPVLTILVAAAMAFKRPCHSWPYLVKPTKYKLAVSAAAQAIW
ncbi:MAG: hypothetical protein AAB401_16445 [Acidobacteriota bacterium]